MYGKINSVSDKSTKGEKEALAEWLSWLECCPMHQKVARLISDWGACKRQPIDVSLFPFLSKINKNILG